MTHDIELALSRGKIVGAKKLLQEYYEKEDYNNWLADRQKEYDGLFTNTYTRDIGFDSNTIINEEDLKEYVIDELLDEEQTFVSCWFDEVNTGNGNYTYSVLEAKLSFNDWLNETKVIEEASYVCDECQLALENDKCINNEEHITRVIPEVTELVRPYIKPDVSDKVNTFIDNHPTTIARKKVEKKAQLDSIVVEVNGKVFDGNETARNNMLSSIQASQLLNIESEYWKLADNSIVEVTLEEIKEALTLAIQRVGKIVKE